MTSPVRIPSDVDREDRMVANLTARQLLLLSVTGIILYAAWTATRTIVPLAIFAVFAVPIGAAAAILVLGQRDGVSLDRLVLAAIRQRLQPRYRVAAPEGVRPAPPWLTSQVPHGRHDITRAGRNGRGTAAGSVADIAPAALRLPAEGVSDTSGIGVVDLGEDGLAVVAVASTVNFALRTPAEQDALVASFGRYLHSLTAPIQVLVRTQRLDLSGQIAALRSSAGGLPHPALEAAAYEHADYLAQLGEQTDLLRRQVLLVLREPVRATAPTDGLGGGSPLTWMIAKRATKQAGAVDDATRRAASTRLVRRLAEAVDLLAPAGIAVTALDAGQATAVLTAACNPDSLIPPSAVLAGADEVITTAGAESWDDSSGASGWWGSNQAAGPLMSGRTTLPLVSTVTGVDEDSGDIDEEEFSDDFDDSEDDEYDEDFNGRYEA